MPAWFSDIALSVLGFAALWILTTINATLRDLKSELQTTNNNLTRLDRRVAFLEGRFFSGHPPVEVGSKED